VTLRIISGSFKGRILKTPKTATTRPTQGMLREAVFNICQNEVQGSFFLDLFAGSGAMSFEALSRGANHATLVEQNRMAIKCITENTNSLQVKEKIRLIPTDVHKALQILKKSDQKFDLVYIDPPYDRPFDLDLLLPLLLPSARIFAEERHDPKKAKSLYQSTHLRHLQSRKFGIALLSIYGYEKTHCAYRFS
jgi:16S rRNA (guanine966-N2)-methyltransferase